MHWPPAPQLAPEGAEGVQATASAPQLHGGGTLAEASAAQLPPVALDPPTTALTEAPHVESKGARLVHPPCASDTIPQVMPWQFLSNVSVGELHVKLETGPHVHVHWALAIEGLAPPANAGSKPAAQGGELPGPSHRTTGPVQPTGTGGAHVAPASHPEPSKGGASGGSNTSTALVSPCTSAAESDVTVPSGPPPSPAPTSIVPSLPTTSVVASAPASSPAAP
jgi:hypothetical protein